MFLLLDMKAPSESRTIFGMHRRPAGSERPIAHQWENKRRGGPTGFINYTKCIKSDKKEENGGGVRRKMEACIVRNIQACNIG
jgi:hypothetical protein